MSSTLLPTQFGARKSLTPDNYKLLALDYNCTGCPLGLPKHATHIAVYYDGSAVMPVEWRTEGAAVPPPKDAFGVVLAHPEHWAFVPVAELGNAS